MGRRICDTDISQEPSKKKNKVTPQNHDLNSSIIIDQPLPPGEILTDVTQKQWRIGKPIGCGSFGEIYLASDDITKEATVQNSRFVIKIEPHSNGPLFVEIHCLIRTARHSKIKRWQIEKKLKLLGMPHYIANGSHIFDNTRYRFLVLPRYECDLEKILRTSSSHIMQLRNVLICGAQIIDVLEYLHSQGYTHSDIKSSNLMVGFDGSIFKNQNYEKSEHNIIRKKVNKNHKQKIKYASYYYDEDFDLHNYLSSNSHSDCETDDSNEYTHKIHNSKFIGLHLRKSKTKKMSPVNARNMRIRGFFNLRKPKCDINYEDLNSSICSYDSYQDLLDNNISANRSQHYDQNLNHDIRSNNNDDNEINHFKEAIYTQNPGQVYLLDFGLASKFVNSDGSHKEFVMDQRKAHDGTLEYSSRDSHIGAHSRRSDLENLGYNILDWLTGCLPWKTTEMLQDPTLVHALKNNCMKDIKQLMEACFKSQSYPKFIEKYFNYLEKLEFDEKPDYQFCRNLFVNEFKDMGFGGEEDMILNFKNDNNGALKKKINYSKKTSNNPSKNTSPDFLKRNAIVKVYGRENLQGNSWENDLKLNLIKESLSSDSIRKPCVSRNFFVSDADLIAKLKQTLLLTHDTPSKKFSPKNLRSKHVLKRRKGGRNAKNNIGKFGNFMGSDKQYTWAEILAGNPESIIRKNSNEKNGQNNTTPVEKNCSNKNPRSRKVSNASEVNAESDTSSNLLDRDFLSSLNPTYAMKEVVKNYKRKILGKASPKNDETDNVPNELGYTPAMIKVMKSMKKRQLEEEKEEVKTKRIIRKKVSSVTRNNDNIVIKSLTKSSRTENKQQHVKKIRGRRKKQIPETEDSQDDSVNIEDEEVESGVRSLRCRKIIQNNTTKNIRKQSTRKIPITKNEDKIETPANKQKNEKEKDRSKKTRKCTTKRAPEKRVIATRSRGLTAQLRN